MTDRVIDCFTHPVTAEVNAYGLRCPLPLLKAKQALRDLAVGEVLRVLATDAGSVRDFQAFANISGHELIGYIERDGAFCYLLKKANSANSATGK
ncbi:sulfurtransferase TusA family protein [Cellvibrio mixtus]|uniref:sulfurtransferase TusA family protein n=1 Tax=Cellvibrio mixtus TaxID=39650 RepID=UPI0005880481|nr:sulfurtransferase TusA family protein [Cellvibrio mixtus]